MILKHEKNGQRVTAYSKVHARFSHSRRRQKIHVYKCARCDDRQTTHLRFSDVYSAREFMHTYDVGRPACRERCYVPRSLESCTINQKACFYSSYLLRAVKRKTYLFSTNCVSAWKLFNRSIFASKTKEDSWVVYQKLTENMQKFVTRFINKDNTCFKIDFFFEWFSINKTRNILSRP